MAQSKNFKANGNVVRNNIIEALRVEINRYKPLTHTEMMNLINQAQNGSQMARTKVINANLRLVWSIAASYGTMMEFEDIFQSGTIGLCKAVDTFDTARNIRFSTWALEQVRKYINIALTDESRTIRMGAHLVKGKNPYLAASMDAPLASDEDGEKTLLDTFASDMHTDNFSEIEEMRVKLLSLMQGLNDTEKAVVCGIFGFGTEEVSEYTLSKKFDLTEERIRQIKWAAIAKMKELA